MQCTWRLISEDAASAAILHHVTYSLTQSFARRVIDKIYGLENSSPPNYAAAGWRQVMCNAWTTQHSRRQMLKPGIAASQVLQWLAAHGLAVKIFFVCPCIEDPHNDKGLLPAILARMPKLQKLIIMAPADCLFPQHQPVVQNLPELEYLMLDTPSRACLIMHLPR